MLTWLCVGGGNSRMISMFCCYHFSCVSLASFLMLSNFYLNTIYSRLIWNNFKEFLKKKLSITNVLNCHNYILLGYYTKLCRSWFVKYYGISQFQAYKISLMYSQIYSIFDFINAYSLVQLIDSYFGISAMDVGQTIFLFNNQRFYHI